MLFLVPRTLLIKHTRVPLRTEEGRIDGVRFVVERLNSLRSEVSLKYVHASGLVDVGQITEARLDVHTVKLLHDHTSVPDEVG